MKQLGVVITASVAFLFVGSGIMAPGPLQMIASAQECGGLLDDLGVGTEVPFVVFGKVDIPTRVAEVTQAALGEALAPEDASVVTRSYLFFEGKTGRVWYYPNSDYVRWRVVGAYGDVASPDTGMPPIAANGEEADVAEEARDFLVASGLVQLTSGEAMTFDKATQLMIRSTAESASESKPGTPLWTAYTFRRAFNGIDFDERAFARLLVSQSGSILGADVSWKAIAGEGMTSALPDSDVNAVLSATLLQNETSAFHVEFANCKAAKLVYRTHRRTIGQNMALLSVSVPIEVSRYHSGEEDGASFSQVEEKSVTVILADENVIDEGMYRFAEAPWTVPLGLVLTEFGGTTEIVPPQEASEQNFF